MFVLKIFLNYFSSVKRKMVFSIGLILIIVISSAQLVIYQIVIPIQMKEAVANDTNEVRFTSERIDQLVAYYTWFMDNITYDQDIQNLLQMPYKTRKDELMLNFELEQRLVSKSIISSDLFQNLFFYDTRKLRTKISNEPFYDPKYLDLHPDIFDAEGTVKWKVEGDQLYIHRAIRNLKTLSLIGFITLTVNANYLKEHIQSSKVRYTFILDEKDELIVQNGKDSRIDHSQLADLVKEMGKPKILAVAPGERMLVTVYQSNHTLWKVVSLVSLKEITKGADLISKWILIIGFIAIVTGTIIVYLVTQHLIIRPIKDLTYVMDQVERDHFNVRVHIQNRDEFGRVGRSFNRMMEKINHLVSEVYQKELSQKEAEYKALKAQINPHFLYNTLETVRWLAEFGETEKIANVTVCLAKLMKESVSNSKDSITVEEELEYIQAYLAIQNTRFHDKVDVFVQIDDAMLDYSIPRLILQPIVENAFIHGLEGKIGRGNLYIKGYMEGQTGAFKIIDDGVGMSEQQIEKIFSHDPIASKKRAGTGNGVSNVLNRLRMIFGDPYGLTIQSSPGIGTTVDIRIPLMMHREEIRNV